MTFILKPKDGPVMTVHTEVGDGQFTRVIVTEKKPEPPSIEPEDGE